MVARPRRQRQGLTAIDGALALLVIVLVVQMWLLSATLEAYLGGDWEAALPAAAVSGVLFGASVGLWAFVARVDAEARGTVAAGEGEGGEGRG